MSAAQQSCDDNITCWWVQGPEGRHVSQCVWEVLQLELSVHPVIMPWSHHAGMGLTCLLDPHAEGMSIAMSCPASATLGAFSDGTVKDRQAHNILISKIFLFIRQPAPCYGAGGTVQ